MLWLEEEVPSLEEELREEVLSLEEELREEVPSLEEELLDEEAPSLEELLREKSLWLEEESAGASSPQEARTNADNSRKTLVTFFISYLLDDKNRQLSIRILCLPASQKRHKSHPFIFFCAFGGFRGHHVWKFS